MSEEVLLLVDGRLMRAQPITVYTLVEEHTPTSLAEVVTPPAAVKKSPRVYTGRFSVKFTPAQKATMVAESNVPGAFVRDIARKWNVNPSSIYHWRRQTEKKLSRSAS